MISFPFFSQPIPLNNKYISVICIENPTYFRDTIISFFNENPEEKHIIFSKNYEPFAFKNHVIFIYDYYNFKFSSTILKKLYNDISIFCQSELAEETSFLIQSIFNFLDIVNKQYDFDFSYNSEFELANFLKSQNFVPNLSNTNLLETLLDYILIVQKYNPINCFILLNLHQYFTENELALLYTEILNRHIPVLVLENTQYFKKLEKELCYILDNDLCEIVEEKYNL